MRLGRHLAIPIVAASACLATSAAASAADTDFTAILGPVGGSGVRATVTVTVPGDGATPTILLLQAEGLTPSERYAVHLHAGTVQQPSASAALLGELDANASGEAALKTASAEAGAVGTHIDLSPELLGDGDHLVDIHDSVLGTVVAAGQIPKFAVAPVAEPEDAICEPAAETEEDVP